MSWQVDAVDETRQKWVDLQAGTGTLAGFLTYCLAIDAPLDDYAIPEEN